MLKVSLLLCFLLIKFSSGTDNFSRDDFPPGFVFGASSSAYQVEGAADEDGRTPSILDTFAHAGNFDGATGDVACDEYHKYKEDVKLMADTGLEAYRFSISWSRLIPNGKGPVNPKGVQYYNNLIDELISNGIQPHVTLHHSDLPQALEDEYGGWVGREIVYSFLPFVCKFNASRRNKMNVIKQFYGCRKDFTAYADVCFKNFGDRVLYWTTMNEPNVFSIAGYDTGFLPPQRCSAPFGVNCSRGNSSVEPYIAVHHLLLSHASAARLYKKKYQDKQHGFVGINVFAYWFVPLTKTIEDELAAQRALDFYTGWILNPLVFGDYPDVMKKNAGSRLPAFTSLESQSVKGSCDFLGINYYKASYAKDYSSVLKKEKRDHNADSGIKIMSLQNDTTFEFPVTSWGLQQVLEYVKQNYGNPRIYIQENGQRTRRNSSLEDWPRVKYLDGHIQTLLEAVRNGSNVRGYFIWSFLDSLELLDGYESSYGLYYIDLDDPDLRRQPKLSAHWYSQFLKRKNVISLDGFIKSLSHDRIQ